MSMVWIVDQSNTLGINSQNQCDTREWSIKRMYLCWKLVELVCFDSIDGQAVIAVYCSESSRNYGGELSKQIIVVLWLNGYEMVGSGKTQCAGVENCPLGPLINRFLHPPRSFDILISACKYRWKAEKTHSGSPNHFLPGPPASSITSTTPGRSASTVGTWFARTPISPVAAGRLTWITPAEE